ncbi:MAG: CinA family protein [Clostridia bacterium]|nr:CinA family protein [Clostridia bacterium]
MSNEFCVERLEQSVRALAAQTVELLRGRGMKISFAESCTGGMLSKLITDVSGASGVFECGVVSYSNRIKTGVLGVSGDVIASYTQVSEQTALQMAERVRLLAGADIGVGTTGASGPASEADAQAGISYVAFSCAEDSGCSLIDTRQYSLNREQNRLYTAMRALELVCDYIKTLSKSGGKI